MAKLRTIFWGTPEFAVPSLEALAKKEEILLVITQPDKRAGRGLKPGLSPIKEKALKLKLEVFQPERLEAQGIKKLKDLKPDIFAVVSYGKILPQQILEIPKLAAINLHASFLPKYRGAAPIHWALMNGEEKTGVTIMKMQEKMDAGEIILKAEEPIKEEDNVATLEKRLAKKGALLLLEAMELIESGKVTYTPQDENLATFAPRLRKSDGLLDFKLKAEQLIWRVRGLNPWPGAYTYWQGKMLKIWQAEVFSIAQEKKAVTGEVILADEKQGIVVACGQGNLLLKTVQLEGGKLMSAQEFLRGHQLSVGEKLG
jgi:methionyl-tRNA formyltransferase